MTPMIPMEGTPAAIAERPLSSPSMIHSVMPTLINQKSGSIALKLLVNSVLSRNY